jgi:hypothetical protein
MYYNDHETEIKYSFNDDVSNFNVVVLGDSGS